MTKLDIIVLTLSIIAIVLLTSVWIYEVKKTNQTKEYLNYCAMRKIGQDINNKD